VLVSYICGGSLRYLGVSCFIVPPHQVTRTNTERTDSTPTAFSTLQAQSHHYLRYSVLKPSRTEGIRKFYHGLRKQPKLCGWSIRLYGWKRSRDFHYIPKGRRRIRVILHVRSCHKRAGISVE